MLLLALLLSHHIPPENYLKCEDYQWLKQGLQESQLFTPAEKTDIILRWINHTDPECFA